MIGKHPVILSLVLAVAPVAEAADPLLGSSILAGTIRGLTGGVVVDSVDVLGRGTVRVGLSGLGTNGGSGDLLDGLDEPGSDETTTTVTRGALTVGLPGDVELAVMMPYLQLKPKGGSGTGGRGDIVLSVKRRLWTRSPRNPGAAISAAYVSSTAATDRPVRTVSHDGYRISLVLQSDLYVGLAETVSVSGELGGMFKDQFRVERDEILLYGVGVTVPIPTPTDGLFDPDTGLFGRDPDGRYAMILEVAGTRFRGDRAPQYDDSITFIPGLRYAASRWGLTVSGSYTTYSRTTKRHGLGGAVLAQTWF